MITTTLCYIEKDGKYLMLHRVKKHNDINEFFDLLQEPRIANIITPP